MRCREWPTFWSVHSVSHHLEDEDLTVFCSQLDANKKGTNVKKSSMPCLCDRTHLCAALEKIRLVENDLYEQEMRKLYNRALAETFDRSSLYAGMERIVSSGIAKDCWTADWKVKFDPIIDILRPLAVHRIFFQHDLFTRGLARLSKLVSSTQIMEEVPLYPGGAPNPTVSDAVVGHYDMLNVKLADVVSSVEIKEVVRSFSYSRLFVFRLIRKPIGRSPCHDSCRRKSLETD